MRVPTKTVSAAAALGLVGIVAAAAPAAAAPAGSTTFWSDAWFSQTSVTVQVTSACTTLPFTAHAELNGPAAINVYATDDCTGPALYFPAGDLHSFIGFAGRSVRLAG